MWPVDLRESPDVCPGLGACGQADLSVGGLGHPPQMTAPFLGSTSDHIRGELAGPRFAHLGRDLYVVSGDEAVSFAQLIVNTRVEAALKVFEDGVISHITSLLLTKVTVDDDQLVHLIRSPGTSRSERDGISVHRVALLDDDTMLVKGTKVTRGPRTLADVAELLDLERLVAIGDQLARSLSAGGVRAGDRARRATAWGPAAAGGDSPAGQGKCLASRNPCATAAARCRVHPARAQGRHPRRSQPVAG